MTMLQAQLLLLIVMKMLELMVVQIIMLDMEI
jgi:hypothetical protein